VFRIRPVVNKKDTIWSLYSTIEPLTDEIKIGGISKKLSKRVFKLLKKIRQPISLGPFKIKPVDLGPYDIDPSSLEGLQNLYIEHPFKKGKNLLLAATNMTLEYSNKAYVLSVFY
jgi:hypothetical protein